MPRPPRVPRARPSKRERPPQSVDSFDQTIQRAIYEIQNSTKPDKQQQLRILSVFAEKKGVFLRWAKPLLARNIPLDVLINETYLYALQHASEYNPKHPSNASFTTWITNEWKMVFHQLLRESEKKTVPVFSHMESQIVDNARTPGENAALREILSRQNAALNALSPKERAVLWWRYNRGLKQTEIEKKFGIPSKYVQQIEKKALIKLGKHSESQP